MQSDRDLLKQALEALEQIKQETFHPAKVFAHNHAITALQERLAQPEQEPVAWTGVDFAIDCTPPRREWVGLTEEEIKALPQWFPSHETAAVMPLIRAVESKLRKMNA